MKEIIRLLAGEGYYVGYYGSAFLLAAYCKLRPHLPHRHTGYVSVNGSVWNCAVCGKQPKGLDRQLAECDLAERVARARSLPYSRLGLAVALWLARRKKS